MVDGQVGDLGAHVPEVVVADHSDELEHVPILLQEMVDLPAQEGAFKTGHVIRIAVQVRLWTSELKIFIYVRDFSHVVKLK